MASTVRPVAQRPPRRGAFTRVLRALRRRARLLHARLHPPGVRLIYDPAYERNFWGVPMDPLRADRILAFLSDEGLIRREEIAVPRPAAIKNVLLAHTPEYLESLQRPDTITGILGTPVGEEERDGVLDLQRLMVGGTILATRLALNGSCVAVNLGGGFHHAEPGRGMGFCVFNDIVISLKRLRRRGWTRRALVVDLDLHDGNGTRLAFADDPTVHTFSIHNQHWASTEAVESTAIELGADVGDELYLGTLLKALPRVVEEFRPGLIIYVAGSDVAEDDAIGNWKVTAEGLLARDRLVVEQARAHQIPLAVLLAGGYGDSAWRYPARFLAWLLAGKQIEPPDNIELTLLRFRQIKRQLDPLRLTRGDEGNDWGLTEEDLVGILPGIPRQTRFLGYFSKDGIELMLERFGILQQLRARGFRSPCLKFDLDHPLGQTLRIYADIGSREPLVELRVARTVREKLDVLAIEWLLLQNPGAPFTLERPQLPGQQHPGLGMLGEFFGWLVVLAESLELDGLFFHPSHYHLAAQSRRHVRFLHPEHEALFRDLQGVLGSLPFHERSRVLEAGRVADADTGATVQWGAHPMVLPVSERMREQVEGEAYEEAARAATGRRLVLLEKPPARAGLPG